MSTASFNFIRVELPVQDETGHIVANGSKAVMAALTADAHLRQMLALAHTLAEALDGIASEIANAADLDADSEQITEAVYSCTDVDAALTILCPHMSKDRPQ